MKEFAEELFGAVVVIAIVAGMVCCHKIDIDSSEKSRQHELELKKLEMATQQYTEKGKV